MNDDACSITPCELAAAFVATMIPINDAPALIGYTEQYGRRLILERAVEGVDRFQVYGRWFVTRAFLKTLDPR